MAPPKAQNNRQQKRVDELFDSRATYWRDAYKDNDIYGIIYQQRQAVALSFIDGLSLPRTARVLEIGCGAGFMTTALAKRGFAVEAIDHAQAMIDLTIEHAKQTGVDNQINACTGDIHELTYESQSFDLIIALGVIPWLHDSQKALTEIKRVVAPRGYVVLSIDNILRATTLLDPLTFPPIARIRRWARRKLERAGLLSSWDLWSNAPPYTQHSIREFNKNLCDAGLTIMKSTSVGFGPFTFFGYSLFSDRTGIKIQQKLQEYADRGYPILRSTGSQYIVLATKKTTPKPIP
ncbi:MAG: methyltransferase domain-containing protein [Candidatus Bathyarchaeia archaeon]|jgi:2-polyprenyl-3-methyl-5-hydroxy-6-metoxy-1,4-benzoquinol methylase